MQIGAHIIAKGIVQGVGFRYFVYLHAKRLGVAGCVRNLYNGNVEIDVEGDRAMVEALIKEVKIGPRSAQVKDLTIEWHEFKTLYQEFEIR